MKKKTLYLILVVLSIFSPIFVNAAPSITLVSPNVSDGQPVTLSGSNFGTHTLSIQWLGGKDGNIEQGTIGNEVSLPNMGASPGWNADVTGENRKRPIYSSDDKHSGTKSIRAYVPGIHQYTTGFFYDNGATFSTVYATWWVNIKNLAWAQSRKHPGGAQWKILRITPGGGGGIYADQPHNWYWPQQVVDNGSDTPTFVGGNYIFLNFCLSSASPSYDSNCYAGNITPYRPRGIIERQWARIEVYSVESSPGSRNGTVQVYIHKQSSTPETFVDYPGNTCTRTNADPQWRYVVFENYLGGGLGKADIYTDDHYIQFGTQARVELCDNAKWSSRKHCEIQYPSSWSDRSISINLNAGSFNVGTTAYLYVVDSGGNVSDGYSVTLGSSSSTDLAPPKGLHIVSQ